MDRAMWDCSLDMASGFWVVKMTERSRRVSEFITPSGLYEWLRMPFGLEKALEIYQRLIDNELYGYLKIGTNPDASSTESSKQIDVFTEGETETSQTPSLLGRRSYIDDILISATSWASLYKSVGYIATCMQQVAFFDQPDQTFLGTTQGGLSRSSSINRWTGSPPERTRIAVQHSVSSNASVDAAVFREFELLYPIH